MAWWFRWVKGMRRAVVSGGGALALLLGLSCPGSVLAASVTYDVTALGAGVWRYDYTVGGTAPAGGFDGLTVYFEDATTGGLLGVTAPPEWDAVLAQPYFDIESDGYVDLLNLAGPLEGVLVPFTFSVEFSFTGNAPGSQVFELYRSDPFEVVAAGSTTALNAVPEPASLALAGLALLAGLACAPRRRA